MLTAYPTPRTTPSPCVVFATPPGSARTSVPAGGGDGADATRRSSSWTGAGPSTTWPVGIVSPVDSALRARSSTGSRPSAAASLSSCDSYAKHACTAPKPRIAPQGGLLVYATYASITTFGTAYGPMPSVAAFARTAGEL